MNTEQENLVPFFENSKNQIIFEFFYLIFLFVLGITVILELHFLNSFNLTRNSILLVYSALGGVIGGWVFVTKWFYRVIARGNKNQYPWKWESHKFYWRIFTPIIAGAIAFCAYVLLYSDLLPIKFSLVQSKRSALAICAILGYFSDILLSRLASWVEEMFANKKS